MFRRPMNDQGQVKFLIEKNQNIFSIKMNIKIRNIVMSERLLLKEIVGL